MAKARLVIKSFEEICNEEISKDVATCSKEAQRIMLALIAQNKTKKKRKLNTIDIGTAFLQREKIDRKVFVMPPKEVETNNVWLSKKCVYNLGDASGKWYNRVKSFLLLIGLKMSKGRPSIFYNYNDNVL